MATGSECTGKTTLAEALAQHCDTVVVPEYARRFVEEQGRAPDYADVETIARGQLDLERTLTPAAHDLIVLDTDLLSTVLYSRHYYGDCPTWIEQRIRDHPGDLYLLCGIDVPWVADGAQRDRGDRREKMHQLFRGALLDRHLDFVELRGDPEARLDRAAAAIRRRLDQPS